MEPNRSPRFTLARLAVLAALAIAMLTLAACGSSSDDEPAAAETAATPVTATGAAAASAASTTPAAAEPFTLRWGVITAGNRPTGPNGLAYTKGELLEQLRPAGVTDIEVAYFPNGPNLAAALVAGELDLGDFGDTPALVAGGQGVAARLLQIPTQNLEAWLIGRKGGPTTLQELVGKKVATAPGSYMDRYLKGLIHEEGLDGKIQVGAMLPAQGVPALQKGSLDAYAFPVGVGASFEEQGYPVIDKASQHEGLTGNSVTLITDDALAKHPQLVQAWRDATKANAEAVRKNPEELWAAEAKNSNVSDAAAKASYPVDGYPLEPFPADALAALQGTLDYLVETKQAKSFDLNAWRVP